MNNINQILNKLLEIAQANNYSGYDPYDGLYLDNLPCNLLKRIKFGRLFLIHLNKRFIFNLRPLFGIKKNINPKAIALYLSGLVKINKLNETNHLLKILTEVKNKKYPYPSWGYYFDWQSRQFYHTGGTSSIVVTSFVDNALLDLYEKNKDPALLETVKDSFQFFYKNPCKSVKSAFYFDLNFALLTCG